VYVCKTCRRNAIHRSLTAAGVGLVREVDPDARTVRVGTALNQSTLLTATDTLDGGIVLPGFTLPLRELFDELDRHG
jgi:pantothenate kinase type III